MSPEAASTSLSERETRLRNIEAFVQMLADVTSRTPEALIAEMHASAKDKAFEFTVEHVPLEAIAALATKAFGDRVKFDEAQSKLRIDEVYTQPVEQALRAISKPL